MHTAHAMTRADAIIALLRDWHPDDVQRTHRLTQEGDPHRAERYADLPMRWTVITREERQP